MKTKYEDGILSFERDGKEKVFCLMGTIFGDGERFCKLVTEKEAEELYDEDMWSKPFGELRISESLIIRIGLLTMRTFLPDSPNKNFPLMLQSVERLSNQSFLIMTIVKNNKKYEINGETYFVEQYADKPDFVWYWRYGKFYDGACAKILKDGLRSRPNLKKLFG